MLFLFVYFIYLYINQVPSDRPAVIGTPRAVDGQSIFLRWRALSQKDVNGILRGYKIWCRSRYSSQILSVSGDRLQVTVTGLTSCVWYTVRISAFTSKGEGPRGDAGYIKTCMYILILKCLAILLVYYLNIPLHARRGKTLNFANSTKLQNGPRTCFASKHIRL